MVKIVSHSLFGGVRMVCIQLNTATADSWSRFERGNALSAIRGLDRAFIVVSGDCIFAPDQVPGFFIGVGQFS